MDNNTCIECGFEEELNDEGLCELCQQQKEIEQNLSLWAGEERKYQEFKNNVGGK